jgi:hypothetical protein
VIFPLHLIVIVGHQLTWCRPATPSVSVQQPTWTPAPSQGALMSPDGSGAGMSNVRAGGSLWEEARMDDKSGSRS